MSNATAALVWLRRDLRLADNAALHAALSSGARVHCAFVFDREILDALPSRQDRRVEFIHASLIELERNLAANGGGLIVRAGVAREEIPRLAAELGVSAVYANRDYEPQTLARDQAVARTLAAQGVEFRTRKDQVVFELEELRRATGKPYTVYTAYKNAWLTRLVPFFFKAYPVERHLANLARSRGSSVPALGELGFEKTNLDRLGVPLGESGAARMLQEFSGRIDRYRELRDFPAVRGTSYLSLHLRFGTVSVRRLVAIAMKRASAGARGWLEQLIWRDFYFAILQAFPHVVDHAFRAQLDALQFANDPGRFAAWCEGRTGYPLVDAGMRQLVQSGYMPNRLRMLTASFLVKHLQVDWRRGERFFAQHLNDYDLAANNGNWQWVASTGCDAQPYFRIFNPVLQSEKFDPRGAYIRRYVPELERLDAEHIHSPWLAAPAALERAGVAIGATYPSPIVDHREAHAAALALYRGAESLKPANTRA